MAPVPLQLRATTARESNIRGPGKHRNLYFVYRDQCPAVSPYRRTRENIGTASATLGYRVGYH